MLVLAMLSLFFFFFKATATTEIYTTEHSFPTRRSSDLQQLADQGWTARRQPDEAGQPARDRPLLHADPPAHHDARAPHQHPQQRRAGVARLQRLQPAHHLEAAGHLQGLLRSEEHTSELQSLMRISYAVFCLKKKKHQNT